MRLNFFSRNVSSEPEARTPAEDLARTGRTFPADEVMWGIVIRNGFDEIDDPLHHRGVTQHAYLIGYDDASICGFRPIQSGLHTRRRSRLGMPSSTDHPMCGMCARMVVAARPKVSVPVQPARPQVAIPVARPIQQPVPMAAPARVVAMPIESGTSAVPTAVAARVPARVPETPAAPVVATMPSPMPPPVARPLPSAPPFPSTPPLPAPYVAHEDVDTGPAPAAPGETLEWASDVVEVKAVDLDVMDEVDDRDIVDEAAARDDRRSE